MSINLKSTQKKKFWHRFVKNANLHPPSLNFPSKPIEMTQKKNFPELIYCLDQNLIVSLVSFYLLFSDVRRRRLIWKSGSELTKVARKKFIRKKSCRQNWARSRLPAGIVTFILIFKILLINLFALLVRLRAIPPFFISTDPKLSRLNIFDSTLNLFRLPEILYGFAFPKFFLALNSKKLEGRGKEGRLLGFFFFNFPFLCDFNLI